MSSDQSDGNKRGNSDIRQFFYEDPYDSSDEEENPAPPPSPKAPSAINGFEVLKKERNAAVNKENVPRAGANPKSDEVSKPPVRSEEEKHRLKVTKPPLKKGPFFQPRK